VPALLVGLAVLALAVAAHLAAERLAPPQLLALLVAVPLGACLVAACLARAAPWVHLSLLVPATALNLLGLVILIVIAPSFAYLQSYWSLISQAAYALLAYHAVDEERLRRLGLPLFLLSLGLVLLTFTAGVNPSGGARRQWLYLGPFYFEPSELLKLALTLMLALYFTNSGAEAKGRRPWAHGAIAVSLAVLTLQGDLGAALMVALIGALIIYAARGNWRRLLLSIGSVALAGVVAYSLLPYVQARLDSWLHPWTDPTGASYQVVQGLRALAAGGLVGQGLSATDTVHVPAAHTDSILTALGERLGLIGTLLTVGLYGVMLGQLRAAYRRARTPLEALLATGVAILLIGQAVLIIGGSTALLPLTGVTLPLVSYGGSSLLMSYLALALVSRGNDGNASAVHARSPSQNIVHLALAAALSLLTVWLSLWHLWGAGILSQLTG